MNPLTLAMFGAICAYVLYEQLSFHSFMSKARRLSQQNQVNEAINHLHTGLERKLFTVPAPRSQIYYAIASAYLGKKDFVSAGKYFQHLVNQSSPFHNSDANERLKECQQALKAQGLAGAIEKTPAHLSASAACLENGKKLFKEGLFEESYAEYLRGYDLLLDGDNLTKFRLITHLSTSGASCGKLEESVFWAEQDVQNSREPALQFTSYSMGSVGCVGLGDLDRAQYFCRQGFLLATDLGDKKQIGRFMGLQANVLYDRGKVRESAKLAEAAIVEGGTNPQTKIAYMVWAKALLTLGDYDRAVEVIDASKNEDAASSDSKNTQVDASVESVKVQALIAKGELDQAMDIIDRLAPVFQGRLQISAVVQLLKVKVYARQGREREALELLAMTRTALEAKMPRHRAMNMSVLETSGAVYYDIGDTAKACDTWTKYISLMPSPVRLQKAYYEHGRSLEALGEVPKALVSYRKCVDTGIESRSVDKARERLSALSNARAND